MPESIFSNIAHVYSLIKVYPVIKVCRNYIVELITQKKCILVSGSTLQEQSLKWISSVFKIMSKFMFT